MSSEGQKTKETSSGRGKRSKPKGNDEQISLTPITTFFERKRLNRKEIYDGERNAQIDDK